MAGATAGRSRHEQLQLSPLCRCRHFAASAVIAFAAATAPELAIAQGPVPDSVASLNVAIHSVVAGGYWANGAQEGSFRVIVTEAGVEDISQQLHLQWLATDADTGSTEVSATVSVDEINEARAEGQVLSLDRDDNAEFGTLRLNVRAGGVHSNEELRYLITAAGPAGKYDVQRMD